MSTHTCKPDHAGVLVDDCERCAEHAAEPMLLTLDADKTRQLWDVMLDAERGDGRYVTAADARAGRVLYGLAIWLERYAGIDPWRPLPLTPETR